MYTYFMKWWFIYAIFASSFWGLRALFFFAHAPVIGLSRKYPQIGFFFESCYQFIFNFVGSMAGWGCFYALIVRLHVYYPEMRGFTIGDIVLFVFAMIGLSGHLPQATYGLIQSFSTLAAAATKKISS